MRGASDPAVVKMAEQRRGRLDVENVERVIAGEGTAGRTCCITWKNGKGVLCRLHRSPFSSLFFVGSPTI